MADAGMAVSPAVFIAGIVGGVIVAVASVDAAAVAMFVT